MRQAFFLALVSVFLSAPAFAANLDGLEARIDAFIASRQSSPDTGVAVGIVENGKLVFFKGYGKRDKEKNLPVTENTLFAIGSCTKSFTSLGIAMLADEGKLSLDAPVRNSLPDFILSDIGVSEIASFTDLLSHRVGMPRHDLLWYLTDFSGDELYERLPYLGFNRTPGKGFREGHQYNNLMYMVSGRAIGQLSGQSWEEFTRERIFKKLGMNSAQFSVEESQKSEDFAQPYTGKTLMPFKNITSVGPAGSVNASVADAVKWISFWQRGGLTESGERLVSEEKMARLFRKESSEKIPEVGVEFDYGLGWFLNEVAGKKIYWHAGNIDGFSAHISFLPGENLGLVVLTNENSGNLYQLPWKLVKNGTEQKLMPYLIYEHLLGAGDRGLGLLEDSQLVSYLQPLAPLVTSVKSPVPAFNSLLKENVFQELGYGRMILRETEGKLALDYYGTELPLTATLFPDVYQTPALDSPGKTWEVRLQRAGEDVLSVSVPLEPAVDPILFVRTQ